MQKTSETLTIIIPTRDRPETLLFSLKTVLAQPERNLEIIVSDNFSGPEVKQILDGFSDSRLKYIRTDKILSMSEHWDFALNHVGGDWVGILGDDDGLLPDAAAKFFLLRERYPTAEAITAANCWYRWPLEGGPSPKYCVLTSHGSELRESRKYLNKLMHGKIVALPTIYTGGFVSVALINKIKALSPDGNFFHSLNPDVYSGMAITSVAHYYAYSWQPLAIAGASKHSNGVVQKNKTSEEKAKLEFFKENTIAFEPKLFNPYTEAMQIFLYEGFLKSSFLRQDDLGVTLEEQLEICIIQSSKRTFRNIMEHCREIANINNIDFEKVQKRALNKKRIYNLQKLGKKLARHVPLMSKRSRKVMVDPALENIMDASLKIAMHLK